MFNLITDRSKQKKARETLEATFSKGATIVRQTLSTPGGKVHQGKIYHRQDLGVWAYFGAAEGNRYPIAFGAGAPTWRIGILINIPIGRTLNSNGQLVENENGEFFLAHKGGLGGGKYSVSVDDFIDLLDDKFVRHPIAEGTLEHEMFVLADVTRSNDMGALAKYIKEAERIREKRRSEGKRKFTKSVVETRKQNDKLTDERDDEGSYNRTERVEFKRRHGQVFKALKKELVGRGYKLSNGRLHGGIKPDLYAQKSSSNGGLLFEIKASKNANSHFTAIGQLLVYAKAYKKDPRKIVVGLGLPGSNLFTPTLKNLDISYVEYAIIGQRVDFEGLNEILSGGI